MSTSNLEPVVPVSLDFEPVVLVSLDGEPVVAASLACASTGPARQIAPAMLIRGNQLLFTDKPPSAIHAPATSGQAAAAGVPHARRRLDPPRCKDRARRQWWVERRTRTVSSTPIRRPTASFDCRLCEPKEGRK